MTVPKLYITKAQRASMREFIREKIAAIPSKISTLTIAEHCQQNRIMPTGTPRPGPWDNDYTPYLVEPMNNMSPRSDIQRTVVMKAAQGGFTAMAENVICFYIGEMPADILLISATERLLERWATRRLEPAIDSYDLRSKIYSQTEVKGSKRTGDKIFSKEYQGCMLDLASAQAASSLRATDKRLLIRDEIDGAPALLRTGEGNWLDVSFARTNAWGHRRKVLDFSTPSTFTESLIWQAYQEGDQRKFLVACPFCGHYQELVMGTDKSEHGLKGSFKGGVLDEVFYLCENCHDTIRDHHKTELLLTGKWEPTAKPSSSSIRSYHWSSLYSPAGMLSWEEIYRHYLKAQETPDGMRSFVNLYLGKPFKETGSRPKLEKVIELRGGYTEGTVPDGVLFLTAGIDVQRGSSRGPGARLEMEICGHGSGFRTWSILYKVFEGEIDDPTAGAWEKLADFARETEMKFHRKDGRTFAVVLILIDSGDGMFTDIVYRFCGGWQSTYPSKGFGKNFKLDRKKDKGDELAYSNFKRYRAVRIQEDIILYEIATNYYKTHLYNNLKLERQDIGEQRAGFCDFPMNYGEEYFRQLTAEERRPSDGSFHLPAGRRNEALDCRVMNLCAADVFLNEEVMNAKVSAQASGATKDQLQQITTKTVLTYLERLVAVNGMK